MHAIFDEAHFTSNTRPTYAQKLLDMADTHLASMELAGKQSNTSTPTLESTTIQCPVPDDPVLPLHQGLKPSDVSHHHL